MNLQYDLSDIYSQKVDQKERSWLEKQKMQILMKNIHEQL